eukprot:754414-Hanusia_phi.AAC.1
MKSGTVRKEGDSSEAARGGGRGERERGKRRRRRRSSRNDYKNKGGEWREERWTRVRGGEVGGRGRGLEREQEQEQDIYQDVGGRRRGGGGGMKIKDVREEEGRVVENEEDSLSFLLLEMYSLSWTFSS